MNNCKCDGATFIDINSPKGQLIAFECPKCKERFHPIVDIDADTGKVHWFAGRKSAALIKATSSGSLTANLVSLGQQKVPLFDLILLVRVDA